MGWVRQVSHPPIRSEGGRRKEIEGPGGVLVRQRREDNYWDRTSRYNGDFRSIYQVVRTLLHERTRCPYHLRHRAIGEAKVSLSCASQYESFRRAKEITPWHDLTFHEKVVPWLCYLWGSQFSLGIKALWLVLGPSLNDFTRQAVHLVDLDLANAHWPPTNFIWWQSWRQIHDKNRPAHLRIQLSSRVDRGTVNHHPIWRDLTIFYITENQGRSGAQRALPKGVVGNLELLVRSINKVKEHHFCPLACIFVNFDKHKSNE